MNLIEMLRAEVDMDNSDLMRESSVTNPSDGLPGSSLIDLGWSEFFGDQILPDEARALPVRIANIHRTRISGIWQIGLIRPVLPARSNTGDFAIGDWVLADPQALSMRRRLARKTVLARRTKGNAAPQLAGANIDTFYRHIM